MSNLSTLPKGDSAWLLRKAIERIIQQVSVLETNIGSSTTGNSANTQVIFNDAGTLRGDPAFVFDAATDMLSVTGFKTFLTTQLSTIGTLYVGTLATPKLKVDVAGTGITTITQADITGDLTVATNRLSVSSTGVQIGTTTNKTTAFTGNGTGLTIGAALAPTIALWDTTNASYVASISQIDADMYMTNTAAGQIVFSTDNTSRYTISSTGIATWSNVGGFAGTAMTLNSTGLGVGVTPSSGDGSGVFKAAGTGVGITNTRLGLDVREITSGNAAGIWLGAMNNENTGVIGSRTASGNIAFQTFNGASWGERMRIDYLGNVGVGVTPSAWSSPYKSIELDGGNLSVYPTTDFYISQNAVNVGGWKYKATGFASQYIQVNSQHRWLIAASGTAGNSITFTQAMTLDASGNLGVGVTAASNTRTHFKGSSTSTDYITFCVNGSDKLVFGARNDGLFITGSSADSASLPNAPYNLTSGSAANVYLDSQGIFYRSTSSLKYKTDIADSTRGLSDVLKLRPVTYKAKNSGDTVFGGLIAEEVDAAGLNEFVQYAPDKTPDAIHYGNMVSLLVAAIKELTARVEALEA